MKSSVGGSALGPEFVFFAFVFPRLLTWSVADSYRGRFSLPEKKTETPHLRLHRNSDRLTHLT